MAPGAFCFSFGCHSTEVGRAKVQKQSVLPFIIFDVHQKGRRDASPSSIEPGTKAVSLCVSLSSGLSSERSEPSGPATLPLARDIKRQINAMRSNKMELFLFPYPWVC